MTHGQRLEHVWSATHGEYRGYAQDWFLAEHCGKHTILIHGMGHTKPNLTEAEMAAKLPVHLRHLPTRAVA